MSRRTLALLAVLVLTVAACGGGQEPGSDDTPTPSTVESTMTDDSMADESMTDDSVADESMTDDSMHDDTMTDDSSGG